MADNALAARITDLREQRNMSQVTLAKKLGLDKSSMSKMEKGTRKVSSDELRTLAEVFEVSTDYLLGHDTPNEPKHIDVDDIVNNQAMLTSRNHALSDEDRKAIRALLTTYLNSDEGQDRLRKFGGYGDDGKKIEDEK